MTLNRAQKDNWGIPLVHVECANERKMAKQVVADDKAMIEAAGSVIIAAAKEPGVPGLGIHEMGAARLSKDPKTSVLNASTSPRRGEPVHHRWICNGVQRPSEPVIDLHGLEPAGRGPRS